jgi:hypothetical protein
MASPDPPTPPNPNEIVKKYVSISTYNQFQTLVTPNNRSLSTDDEYSICVLSNIVASTVVSLCQIKMKINIKHYNPMILLYINEQINNFNL